MVADSYKLDKKELPKSKAKIEFNKQDVVHSSIKDKVLLYRQTCESQDTELSQKFEGKNKQSSPLVLSSKPKN
jgi:hypothetical protein